MSESKARLEKHALWLAGECDRMEGDIVFLLQALMDVATDHPEIEMPDVGNKRFPERIWRRINV